MCCLLAGQYAGVAVPSVVDVDSGSGAVAGGYLVMSECAGRPWHELRAQFHRHDHDQLRAEVGRQVAMLHTITGSGFGYPSIAAAPEFWRVAFLEMVDAVLADAGKFAVALPRPAAEIRELLAARAQVLDEVRTPVLVHFDLWDGNLLVDVGQGRAPRVGGLIDAERAFWGDPLAELRRRWRCSATSSRMRRSCAATGRPGAR